MTLSKQREAIVKEFKSLFPEDSYMVWARGHSDSQDLDMIDYLTQALKDYTEEILRMVEGKYKNSVTGTKHVRIDDDYPPIACEYNDALNDIKEELQG